MCNIQLSSCICTAFGISITRHIIVTSKGRVILNPTATAIIRYTAIYANVLVQSRLGSSMSDAGGWDGTPDISDTNSSHIASSGSRTTDLMAESLPVPPTSGEPDVGRTPYGPPPAPALSSWRLAILRVVSCGRSASPGCARCRRVPIGTGGRDGRDGRDGRVSIGTGGAHFNSL